MKIGSLLLFIAVACLLRTFPSHAAGFDCSKAAIPTDFVVCSSPELLAANDAHAQAWAALVRSMSRDERDHLVAEQRQWLRDTNLSCGLPSAGKPVAAVISRAAPCVLRALQLRKDQLVQSARYRHLDKTTACARVRATGPAQNSAESVWRCGEFTIVNQLSIGPPAEDASDLKVSVRLEGRELLTFGSGNRQVSFGTDEDPVEGAEDYAAPGINVTGGTTPQIAALAYSGGANCCWTYFLVDLGRSPTILSEVSSQTPISLLLPENSKTYEVRTTDTFEENRAFVEVTKLWDGHAYHLASARMKHAAPTDDEIKNLAENLIVRQDEEPSPDLWQEIVDLVYSGNLKSAETLFEQVRAPLEPTARKKEFDATFKCFIPSMASWDDVAAMNGVPATKPICAGF